MATLLYIMGIVVIIISIAAGIYSGAFIEFFISIAGGIASAIIFFALAKILQNQETILYKLAHKISPYNPRQISGQSPCPVRILIKGLVIIGSFVALFSLDT